MAWTAEIIGTSLACLVNMSVGPSNRAYRKVIKKRFEGGIADMMSNKPERKKKFYPGTMERVCIWLV